MAEILATHLPDVQKFRILAPTMMEEARESAGFPTGLPGERFGELEAALAGGSTNGVSVDTLLPLWLNATAMSETRNPMLPHQRSNLERRDVESNFLSVNGADGLRVSG